MQNNKIKIAVSSCLLGEAVRYDGTDKHIEYITQQLETEYNLISICPEMAVGMGVPRPPIHLVNDGNGIQVVGVENPDKNMTLPLTDYGKKVTEEHSDICGYILKKNSPSCGIKNVKVLNTNGEYERTGQGVYVRSILNHFPTLPIIDEEDLASEIKTNLFLNEVLKYSENMHSLKKY